MSRYQKGKNSLDLLEQEIVSSSGISKSSPHPRQITMPAPTTQDFYRPNALPVTQPTASKHWRLFDTTQQSQKSCHLKLLYYKHLMVPYLGLPWWAGTRRIIHPLM